MSDDTCALPVRPIRRHRFVLGTLGLLLAGCAHGTPVESSQPAAAKRTNGADASPASGPTMPPAAARIFPFSASKRTIARLEPVRQTFPDPTASPRFSDALRSKTPEVVVFGGDDAIVGAAWVSAREVIAHSRRSLFRVTTDGSPPSRVRFGAPIAGVAASASSGVVAVLTEDNVLRVPLAPPPLRRIDLGADPPPPDPTFRLPPTQRHVTLSANGRILGVTEFEDRRPVTRFFDLSNGRDVSRIPMTHGRLTDTGDFVAVGSHSFSTADGKPLSDKLGSAQTEWIGERHVVLLREGILLFDAPTGTEAEIPASCPGRIEDYDVIDTVGRRVVRLCGQTLFVIDVDKASLVAVPIAPPPGTIPEHHAAHELLFARDNDGIVVWWQAADAERDVFALVTPSTGRASRIERRDLPAVRWIHAPTVSPLLDRAGACKVRSSDAASPAWCSATLSADRRAVFAVGGGALAVADVAGKELARVGPPLASRYPHTEPTLQPRDGGLDVYLPKWREDALEYAYRIGPTASAAPSSISMVRGDLRCESAATSRRLPHRVTAYSISQSRSEMCQCNDDGCWASMPGDGTSYDHARDGRLLFVRSESPASFGKTQVSRAFVKADAGTVRSPELGSCETGAFAADGKSVLVLCTTNDIDEIVELSMPDLKLVRRQRLENRPAETHSRALIAGKRRVIVIDRLVDDRIDARILQRSDGRRIGTLHAWSKAAVVRYADGKVELFGTDAERALACTTEEVVRPFSECRQSFEVKKRFSFD